MSNEDDELLMVYVGTSDNMRSSGTVEPVAAAEAPRSISELFDRAEEDRWREVVIVSYSWFSSN